SAGEHTTSTSGLYVSANFCAFELLRAGVMSKLVVVNDNNDIDREVTKFNPTHVIIEALWVVPSKFEVLNRLHPNVDWIIRIHSNLPFLAQEGIAMDWVKEYVKLPKVHVSGNSQEINRDLKSVVSRPEKVIYLPNCYILPAPKPSRKAP